VRRQKENIRRSIDYLHSLRWHKGYPDQIFSRRWTQRAVTDHNELKGRHPPCDLQKKLYTLFLNEPTGEQDDPGGFWNPEAYARSDPLGAGGRTETGGIDAVGHRAHIRESPA
jgi:hypothetical protein